ncbi:unnamed protein product [Allacma fusca]|uniref:Uncharacterized protein n=1 Tax=Allacma fusca TaxID=39272 RepID=A0A8J2J3W5_9HEXA|nr:unnamed protein product [Allacma fusca]
MGNKSSSAHGYGSLEEAQSLQRSNLKRKKTNYDYVFNDDDPRSWLPTDLTKSKLDLLEEKLCPGAPPPTHASNPIPKTSEPSSLGSFYVNRQIEMAPFTFKRSRGQHPEGFETVPKFSIPSLMLQSTSKSSNASSERLPTKMAQGDERRYDKNYKPAWLPDVKPSHARTNLTPDSQAGILRRSRSFFRFKLKRSSSTDRKAAGESRSIQKIHLRSRSVSAHNSVFDSVLGKWKRTYKIENDTVTPEIIYEKRAEPSRDVASGSSSSSYSSGSHAPKKKPSKTSKKPPPKKDPGKGSGPPKKDSHKKPPKPPKKPPKKVQSQEKTSASPQDGGNGGESGGGSKTSGISYHTPPKGSGSKSPSKSDSRGSPAYSNSTSGSATPKGGKGKGGGKKRPPPPPVFISNCCGGGSSKKSALTPADRLENVDIVEELTYCCPTDGGGAGGFTVNGNNDCGWNNNCDYYSCCNDCGGIQPVPKSNNNNSCGNNSNPVKYSRRQRFNFNDGKRRGAGDDCNDGPPYSWQDRPPNPYDEIPVGKNPVATCYDRTQPFDSTVEGHGNLLPSDSGTYFYDAEQRSFVPVLEIETPETPRQEIHDEIIDEEPVLTNIEPIIQPMMQPMFGGCCPCPLPPFCGVMGQPCCINPGGNDSGSDKGGKKGKSKSSKNKDSKNNQSSPNCAPDPGMMGLCGMNMPGLANMGPYGSLIVPQFNYQPPPCPPCQPCCPCAPNCPCCPPAEQRPCCPCPPCQPMSCAPVCFPPYGGYPMSYQDGNKKKKKKDKKKKKGNDSGVQHDAPNNAGTNTHTAYGGGSVSNDDDDE